MKKITCMAVMAMMLFVAVPAQAQFSWGIKGGVNLVNNDFSALKGMANKEQIMNKDNYTGFFIGPKAEVRIPILGFGIEAAALYSQKGMSVGDNETFKQNSFLIPLNVKYAFGLGNFANVFIAAGPEFGFNMGETSKVINDIVVENGVANGDIKAYVLEKSTLSINVGVGATLFNHLQVGVNYNMPWGKTAEFQTISAEDIQNVQEVDPENLNGMTIGKFNDIKQSINNINDQYQNAMANIKAGTIQVSVAYLF